jgi:hypothetical protein
MPHTTPLVETGRAEEDVMRPVVSSIVALAIAFAPIVAYAAPEKGAAHKPIAAKVMKHHKKTESRVEKVEKAEKVAKVEKADKSDKSDKSTAPISHVRHSGKVALHHASAVDVSGAGHKEPKIEKGVQVVPASMVSAQKPAHGKLTHVSHMTKVDAKPADMPKLPDPNATKASKSGHEKGAGTKKPAEKKNDDGGDKDGKAERDGEMADLVARIRGKKPLEDDTSEPKSEAKGEPKAKTDGIIKAKAGSKGSPTCTKEPVEMIRGPEIDTFQLTKCDGTIAPLAIEHLSILVRPGSAARPTAALADLAKKKGAEISPGVHRIDERLALRLQSLADHFAKAGTPPVKLDVVSGYRPTSVGSMHATGRAIDFRLEGVKNEDVVAFCKTLTDTGCGFYPNSSFVHLDVRDPGAGHVSWIDASGPGEAPHYVSTWPLHRVSSAPDKLEPASAKEPIAKPECDDAKEPVEEHSTETPQ